MIRLKTILHPTDFSAESQHALEVACALARDQAARVILLHVVPRPVLIGRDCNVPAFKEAHAEEDHLAYREEMEEKLEKLRRQMPAVRLEAVLKEGDVAEVVTRTADEAPCDLIVLGAHGSSGMHGHMMGSVAAEVTQKATCPVVTVALPLSGAAPSPA